jgi:cell division protein FtsZ
MSEVRDAVKTVQAFAAAEAFVKYGTVFDETMEDRIRITVVATGLGAPRSMRQPVMQVVAGTGTYGPMGGGAVDMNNLDVPAVMRNPRRTTVEAMSTNGVGTYDIPAFLRRQAD